MPQQLSKNKCQPVHPLHNNNPSPRRSTSSKEKDQIQAHQFFLVYTTLLFILSCHIHFPFLVSTDKTSMTFTATALPLVIAVFVFYFLDGRFTRLGLLLASMLMSFFLHPHCRRLHFHSFVGFAGHCFYYCRFRKPACSFHSTFDYGTPEKVFSFTAAFHQPLCIQ